MRIGTLQVFDEIISGTTDVWYSGTAFNQQMGQADYMIIQAVTTGVSGDTPKLTVTAEDSPDGKHWLPLDATAEIPDQPFEEDGSLEGLQDVQPAPNVRLKMSMTAASGTPKCRLRVYVTLRANAVPWQATR